MNPSIEVLITTPIASALVDALQQISPNLKISVLKANKSEEVSDEMWQRVEILYTNRIIPTPEQAPKLRWIQFHWAGIDHALQEPILRQSGMVTTTLSGAASSQMAEYILLAVLALGHRLPDLMAHQRRAEWPQDRWERFMPLELRNSTVGFIGYGSIARQSARLLNAFGAKTLATKRDAMHPEDLDYTPAGTGDPGGHFLTRLYPPEALRQMLKDCDYVVVTVPKTASTTNMISTPEFAVMKPTAFLVDTSRGGIVDHKALVVALTERKIAGAALDVFPEEPLPADNPLWKLPNVIVTPHISGNTPFYNERAMELFAENLRRYLDGLPLLNVIDVERGY
jgi:phosphoglycerate dehydrogenase-like enzyme